MNEIKQRENLTPEQIFKKYKHLGKKTVHMMFPDLENFCDSVSLDKEDLYSFGLIGCWKASNTYHTATHNSTLRSFVIRNIRWTIQMGIRDEGLVPLRWKTKLADEENKVGLISMDNKIKDDSEETYHDLVKSDYYLEGEAVGNLLMKMVENKYSDRIIHIIKRRSEGANNKEIGDELGLSRERVRQILNQVRNELKGVI